jgi:hypothetical protein
MGQGKHRTALGRRSFIAATAGSAGLLGLAAGTPILGNGPAAESPLTLSLGSLPFFRNYEARRASSYDRSGGNADNLPEAKAGEVQKIMDVTGPGQVTHIWLAVNTDDPLHLKRIVLRAYWDGESSPSVEVPIGDFFGMGLGEFFTYQSALTNVAPWRGMNCYFPMPFAKSALLTLTNEGPIKADNYYFNIDYVSFDRPLEGAGYFHAQYRQQAPCQGWTNDWKSNSDPLVDKKTNLDGKDNYVFFEAEGRGHFLGVAQAVLQNQDGWYGEGDEMIFIDSSETPVITGTGTEDYFNGSWDYKGPSGPAQPYNYLSIGTPFVENAEKVGGRYCSYRWHLESPIPFRRSIKVTIEHGHANHRSDNFYTVGYWYQTEPHKKFPELPRAEDRVPRVMAVGGPGAERQSS